MSTSLIMKKIDFLKLTLHPERPWMAVQASPDPFYIRPWPITW